MARGPGFVILAVETVPRLRCRRLLGRSERPANEEFKYKPATCPRAGRWEDVCPLL
jgi:hypothetical protein